MLKGGKALPFPALVETPRAMSPKKKNTGACYPPKKMFQTLMIRKKKKRKGKKETQTPALLDPALNTKRNQEKFKISKTKERP